MMQRSINENMARNSLKFEELFHFMRFYLFSIISITFKKTKISALRFQVERLFNNNLF